MFLARYSESVPINEKIVAFWNMWIKHIYNFQKNCKLLFLKLLPNITLNRNVYCVWRREFHYNTGKSFIPGERTIISIKALLHFQQMVQNFVYHKIWSEILTPTIENMCNHIMLNFTRMQWDVISHTRALSQLLSWY